MAMRQFYSEIKGLKVKELPAYVKPMLSVDYVKKAVQRGLDNYNAKYIQTGSIDPLLHVCFGVLYLLRVKVPQRCLWSIICFPNVSVSCLLLAETCNH
ncbi:hypothetical protein SDJN03_15114, partial [Cucurbita argyrosperma subsp. sororia]